MNLYVASSWRNEHQPDVVHGLREAGHRVYDFRRPTPDSHGFHWSEIDPAWKSWTAEQYIAALDHPLAADGFVSDFNALVETEGCVLVLPSGPSAHLEAGYFVGAKKPLWILLAENAVVPELMYLLAGTILTGGVFSGLRPILLAIHEYENGRIAGRTDCD